MPIFALDFVVGPGQQQDHTEWMGGEREEMEAGEAMGTREASCPDSRPFHPQALQGHPVRSRSPEGSSPEEGASQCLSFIRDFQTSALLTFGA